MEPSSDTLIAAAPAPGWRDYLELTKPRVVTLLVFTAVVGMLLAVPGWPPLVPFVAGLVGIWLAAASAAAVNHVIDRNIDSEMARTRHRPLAKGAMRDGPALTFAFTLGVVAMFVLVVFVNTLTALLTFASLIGYAIIYTSWLKRATPQNIVIGGAAGAAPPLLGWAAMTNTVDPGALLLFLIVFAWTPPHFWALAIAKREEYAKVGIPMLPVAYGVELTRLHILLYTVLLTIVTLLVWLTGVSGGFYLVCAVILNGIFLGYAWRLYRTGLAPMRTFVWSITYLGLLFAALLVDHYVARWLPHIG
jgi:protoheme IX farnesyltransferase